MKYVGFGYFNIFLMFIYVCFIYNDVVFSLRYRYIIKYDYIWYLFKLKIKVKLFKFFKINVNNLLLNLISCILNFIKGSFNIIVVFFYL